MFWILRVLYPEMSEIFEILQDIQSAIGEMADYTRPTSSEQSLLVSKLHAVSRAFRNCETDHKQFFIFGKQEDGEIPETHLPDVNKQLDSAYRLIDRLELMYSKIRESAEGGPPLKEADMWCLRDYVNEFVDCLENGK